MPLTPLVIAASTSAVCLGELRWPSATIRSMSPSLVASSLICFSMCTKNGNARSGIENNMVRCFSAARAGPNATNARQRVATSLILLEYFIEFFRPPRLGVGFWGDEGRNTQILAHAPLRENGQSDKFATKNG